MRTIKGSHPRPAQDTAWMDAADCARRVHAGLAWLADADQVSDKDDFAMALVCAECPVRARCAAYVAGADVTGGFWSGRGRLPSRWLTEAAEATPDADAALSWVSGQGRHGQQWEQAALRLGGTA